MNDKIVALVSPLLIVLCIQFFFKMLFVLTSIFPIFAFSECQLETSSSAEYGTILNITDFVQCSDSSDFRDYRTVSAVSFSKTDTTFDNIRSTALFSLYDSVRTVMFEGNVQEAVDDPVDFSNLQLVIFYGNIYSVDDPF